MKESFLGYTGKSDNLPNCSREEAIQSYLETNAQINEWYHRIGNTLKDWIGEPEVINWALFARFISLNAATGAKQMNDTLKVLDHICELNASIGMQKQTIWRRDVFDLGKQIIDCISGGIKLLLRDFKTGVAPIKTIAKLKGIQIAETEGSDRDDFIWPDPLRSKLKACEIPKIIIQVFKEPELFRRAIEHLMIAVEDANRDIYSYMSINFEIFEKVIRDNPETDFSEIKFMDDEKGFFKSAICEYQNVRKLGMELAKLSVGSDEWIQIFDRRNAAVRKANLLITFNEQAFRVQPRYVGLERIIDIIFYDAKIITERNTFQLLPKYDEGNWANVLTRMGLRTDGIKDFNNISPDNFPETLDKQDPRYEGTIAAFFDEAYEDCDKYNLFLS